MTNGKGDTPRPLSIPADRFKANWDETFHGYVDTPGYAPTEDDLPKPKPPETLGNPEE
jgi:hypothetical protein